MGDSGQRLSKDVKGCGELLAYSLVVEKFAVKEDSSLSFFSSREKDDTRAYHFSYALPYNSPVFQPNTFSLM
jgi:hypothetical protein